jgi:hypothetical protein
MALWDEKYDESEDNPEGMKEKLYDEKILKLDKQLEKIPKEWWTEEVERIQDPKLRKKETDAAIKIAEKEKRLDDKLESGEISKDRYDFEKLRDLGKEKVKFSMSSGLESVDLSWDHIGDLIEDYDILVSGDPKTDKMKEGVKKLIRNRGPKYAKEVADRMLEKDELSKSTYDTIMRQIRLHGKKA